jgi:hypothetical protein
MKRASHVRRVFLACAMALMAFAIVGPALAQASDPSPRGFIEICKNSDSTAPVSGNFDFLVNGIPVRVATGTCSAPMDVPAGRATVRETATPSTAVTSISTIPSDRLVSSSLADRTAVVNVPAGDISTTTTVNYTNHLVTGFVEVCKRAAANSGLTGSFQFTITGAMGFAQTVSVPVGACSNSLQVPAGQVQISESGDAATFVTAITAQPSNALISSDLNAASAVISVPAGDVSTESIATFTNDTARLKICKVAGDRSLLGQTFTFTANGTNLSVPAGAPPNGTCVLDPVPFRAGTSVTVAEGINQGTQVSAIAVAPSSRIHGSADLAARTVTVTMGSGETVVTYTNVPAPPGTLKICKNAGPGVTAGSLWTFSVAGMAGTTTVPAGSCSIVGTFPFNSTQRITETAAPGFVVSAITASPASRLVGTPDLAGRSASVLIGSGVTEAIYTNATAPATTGTTGGGGSTTGGGGSTTGTGGTTTGGGGSTTAGGGTVHAASAHVMMARLLKRHGHAYLVVKVASSAHKVRLLVVELNSKGHVIRRLKMSVKSGAKQTVSIPSGTDLRRLRVALG